MSESLKTMTRERAKAWNSKQEYFILAGAIDEFPGLGADRGSDDFYEAVMGLQEELCIDVDGFYGLSTHAEMIHAYGSHLDFIVHNGARMPIQTNNLFYIQDFTEDPLLDLHKYGNFSKRKTDIEFIVCHHGGLSVHHLARVFSNTERKVSSHFGIGLDENGEVFVAQYLDTKWKAWHAGGWNEGSIGIDICFQPETKWNEHYGVEIIDNPSSRGPRRINDLPEGIVVALDQLISQLSLIFLKGDAVYAPEVDVLYSKEEFQSLGANVVGHHHKTANKWDCSYAWQRLKDAGEARREGRDAS